MAKVNFCLTKAVYANQMIDTIRRNPKKNAERRNDEKNSHDNSISIESFAIKLSI